MMQCRKCKTERKNSEFKHRKYEFLTLFQRETCKFCWAGKPFATAIRKGDVNRPQKYFIRRRAKRNILSNRRRAAKLKATPKWANTELMQKFYTEAAQLSAIQGISYHVDHIVPLRGRTVCGLHNHFNLQVLEGRENIRKGNRFEP